MLLKVLVAIAEEDYIQWSTLGNDAEAVGVHQIGFAEALSQRDEVGVHVLKGGVNL